MISRSKYIPLEATKQTWLYPADYPEKKFLFHAVNRCMYDKCRNQLIFISVNLM